MQRKKKSKSYKKSTKNSGENIIQSILSSTIEEGEGKTEKVDRQFFLKQYAKLNKELNKDRAFMTRFKGLKDLFYISFKEDRNKADYEAYKYFRDSFHPSFMCEEMLHKTVTKRIYVLDKYSKEKKVPIIDLLQLAEVTLPCKACGKGKFDYEDYEMRRCFVTEEFDQFPFTKGLLLCKSCFNEYMK